MTALKERQADLASEPTKLAPQSFVNGEIHDWYRIILGYSDHLVSGLLDRFEFGSKDRVLDPFCGTGTTLIESMKRGVPSVGIDANPSSVFAANVKTNWSLDPQELRSVSLRLADSYTTLMRKRRIFADDPTSLYLHTTGMVERGWISPKPLKKALALKLAIAELPATNACVNALRLALVAEVVQNAANVKFGPELYCGPAKDDVDVLSGFLARINTMANDLAIATSGRKPPEAHVLFGDARQCGAILNARQMTGVSGVICSPPYPTEHDYTRNSRLELAFLEMVVDRDTLRSIKKEMIRSHTKGIYKDDDDHTQLARHSKIARITAEIDERVKEKTHGFARLYSTVVREYFGGMQKHFREVYPILRPGGMCAYVVGDQSSYVQVHIDTAAILGDLAERAGFELVDIDHWRSRWSSTTSREIGENILILRKPPLKVVNNA